MRGFICSLFVVAVLFCFAGVVLAEHGMAPGKPMKEHPGETGVLTAGDVIKGIKDHIAGVTMANAGFFAITDPVDGTAHNLKLVKVHEDKVSYIKKDDAYFACTDFASADGKAMYDIDFWMKKGAGNSLTVYQTKIHKKDGVARFTYKDDEIVAVK